MLEISRHARRRRLTNRKKSTIDYFVVPFVIALWIPNLVILIFGLSQLRNLNMNPSRTPPYRFHHKTNIPSEFLRIIKEREQGPEIGSNMMMKRSTPWEKYPLVYLE